MPLTFKNTIHEEIRARWQESGYDFKQDMALATMLAASASKHGTSAPAWAEVEAALAEVEPGGSSFVDDRLLQRELTKLCEETRASVDMHASEVVKSRPTLDDSLVDAIATTAVYQKPETWADPNVVLFNGVSLAIPKVHKVDGDWNELAQHMIEREAEWIFDSVGEEFEGERVIGRFVRRSPIGIGQLQEDAAHVMRMAKADVTEKGYSFKAIPVLVVGHSDKQVEAYTQGLADAIGHTVMRKSIGVNENTLASYEKRFECRRSVRTEPSAKSLISDLGAKQSAAREFSEGIRGAAL